MDANCPCKDCPDCIRRIVLAWYGKSCHSSLCPFGWEKWNQDHLEKAEKLRKQGKGRWEANRVRESRVLRALKNNRRNGY